MPYPKDPNANALCSKTMMRAMWVLGAGFIATAFVGFLGVYHKHNPAKQQRPTTAEDINNAFSRSLLGNIKEENIKQYLRLFSEKPHLAGTKENREVADKIAKIWSDNGLEDVHFVEYDVLLSYPDYKNPNRIYIIDEDGRVVLSSTGINPETDTSERIEPGSGTNWIAYSGNGTAEGDIVYCHYGRVEDFERLRLFDISVDGKIALLRYGAGFLGDKVQLAQLHGAVGVILFSDTLNVVDLDTYSRDLYSMKERLPNLAVPRGSVMNGRGDPLSPLCPSRKDLYRARTARKAREEGVLPTIPVIPVSYADAYSILSLMQGRAVPLDWQGAFNITYHLGPRMKYGQKVRFTVKSSLQIRRIRNVIGYIHGVRTLDRYVILGNHYDSWFHGSFGANSGTAVLSEVARAMVQAINESQWRPARTLMFCSWDAGEYGLIGSTEFVEEFANILSQRAVVYLNMGNIISNQSLSVSTVPTLYQVATDTAKRIENPSVVQRKKGKRTIYDTWIETFPNELDFRPDAPRLKVPGDGSDYAPFLHFIGVPVIDFTYVSTAKSGAYPFHQKLYEMPYINERFVDDENFSVHVAVGKYWTELARHFTDSAILPLNVSDLANALLRIYIPDLEAAIAQLHHREEIKKDAIRQLSYLKNNSQEFLDRCTPFYEEVNSILQSFSQHPYDARGVSLLNDRLMAIERCFINPRGSPGRPEDRHVLFSYNENSLHSSRVMAAIYDQIELFKATVSERKRHAIVRELATQISLVQYSVQCASSVLHPVI